VLIKTALHEPARATAALLAVIVRNCSRLI
jgi:hypothetical protein